MKDYLVQEMREKAKLVRSFAPSLTVTLRGLKILKSQAQTFFLSFSQTKHRQLPKHHATNLVRQF